MNPYIGAKHGNIYFYWNYSASENPEYKDIQSSLKFHPFRVTLYLKIHKKLVKKLFWKRDWTDYLKIELHVLSVFTLVFLFVFSLSLEKKLNTEIGRIDEEKKKRKLKENKVKTKRIQGQAD